MSKNGNYQPKPEHKFTFGLWTVGNLGRDPFGDAVRESMPPTERVDLLGEVGAWGVNLHDNDLVPIDATAAERDKIVCGFKKACERNHIVVPMATVNLFYHPVFRDGAFTSNDPYADEPGMAMGRHRQLEARAKHDTWDRLDQIRCPTLVCAGRYDGIAPQATVAKMANRIRGAELRLFEGGHMFMIQDRDAFPAMIHFLKGEE